MMKKIINISAMFAPVALMAISANPVQSASLATLELNTVSFGSEIFAGIELVANPGGSNTPIPFTSATTPIGGTDNFIDGGDLVNNTNYNFTWDLTSFGSDDFLFTLGDTFGDGLNGGEFRFTDPNGEVFATTGLGGTVDPSTANDETYAFTTTPESSTLGMIALLAGIGGVSVMQRKHRKNKLKSTTFTCSINQK